MEEIVINGIVKDEIIIPEKGAELPEGIRVEVVFAPPAMTPELKYEFEAWDRIGMELYLDGELAAEVDFKGGPAKLDDDFWVGNIDIDAAANPDLYSKWLQDELYIFDNQLKKSEIRKLMKSS